MPRTYLGPQTVASTSQYALGTDLPMVITAPSGSWQGPINMVTSGNGVMTSGVCTFVPIDVGPAVRTFTTIGCAVGVAQVAGTTTTTLALYADDGTGGAPNLTPGAISGTSGTINPSTTGNKTVVWGSALPLQPGRYWGACLYVVGTTPTTATQLICTTGSSGSMNLNANQIGTVWRGWSISGLSALPTSGTLTQIGGSTAVVVAIRVQ